MAISIKDPETERLIREASERTSKGLTEVVRLALLNLLKSIDASEEAAAARRNRIHAVRMRAAARPVLDARSAEQILGYDTTGAPS